MFRFIETGERHLQLILEEIHQVTKIERLGLNLGLHMSAIDKIQAEYSSPEERKTRIIWHWLQRKDIIPNRQSHDPSWNQLCNAISKESTALSLRIRAKYCPMPPLDVN